MPIRFIQDLRVKTSRLDDDSMSVMMPAHIDPGQTRFVTWIKVRDAHPVASTFPAFVAASPHRHSAYRFRFATIAYRFASVVRADVARLHSGWLWPGAAPSTAETPHRTTIGRSPAGYALINVNTRRFDI
jgi:hypothetical protein